MKLTNEIALVTGGSRGIGKSTALALAQAGAEVIINYVSNKERAESVCHEIEKLGGKAMAAKFDVGNPEEIETAMDAILKEKKKITILVNNAGIAHDGLMMRYATEDWNRVIDTNLRGAFLVSQACVRGMMKERRGSIIHVSSIVGVIGNPGQAAYCAAKAGLIGLTKSMAKELCTRNIRVNAVAPGYIETDMTTVLTPEQRELMVKNIPLGRVGKPEEIADAILFLAGPTSSYITGQTLLIDGGMGM